jgi:hypothetical protein
MAEIREFRESTQRLEQNADIDPLEPIGEQPARYCAYNLTGQRFISNEVVVADTRAIALEYWLSSLAQSSGAAVWLVQIQTLSARSFRFPADLLYLDESCAVIETAQSFPIAQACSSVSMAVSVLALPAQTICSMAIGVGDRLMVCGPDEMQRHLLSALDPFIEHGPKPQLVPSLMATPRLKGTTAEPETDQHPKWEEPLQNAPVLLASVATDSSAWPSDLLKTEDVPVTMPPLQNEEKSASKMKWWLKLLFGEPPDPREAAREALTGLVAYFFTGGVPVPHSVRNISTSGLFVITEERWYKGTFVRMTLTDRREPTAERSITLHARVVRWTEDGVALNFVLHEKNERLRGTVATLDHLPGGARVTLIEEFIARFKPDS